MSRRGLSIFVLIASITVTVQPVEAQDQYVPSPPVIHLADRNGVDLRTGSISRAAQTVTMTAGANRAMAFDTGETRFGMGTTPTDAFVYPVCVSSTNNPCGSYFSVLTMDDGNAYVHMPNSSFTGNFGVAGYPYLRVQVTSSEYIATKRDGEVWHFSKSLANNSSRIGYYNPELGVPNNVEYARLSEIEYPDGEIYKYYYDPIVQGQYTNLRSIVSSSGMMLYRGTSGERLIRLSEVYCAPTDENCQPSGPGTRSPVSGYSESFPSATSSGSTFRIDGPQGYWYQYQTQEYTTSLNCGVLYQERVYPVAKFSDPTGTTTYSYQYDNNKCDRALILHAEATYPDGSTLTVNRTSDGWSLTDAEGHTTTYSMNEESPPDHFAVLDLNVAKVVHPEMNYETYQYDDRGNLTSIDYFPKPGSGQSMTSESWSYPSSCDTAEYAAANCNEPVSYTDKNGYETDYTFNGHGQITSELGPAVDGVRPLTRWIYEDLYAYVLNSSGALVSAATPISMLSEEIQCRSSLNSTMTACGSAGDEVTTSFEYGHAGAPNTLLLRGKVISADGKSLRTCYSYDASGDKISEAEPRADLSDCS